MFRNKRPVHVPRIDEGGDVYSEFRVTQFELEEGDEQLLLLKLPKLFRSLTMHKCTFTTLSCSSNITLQLRR